MYGNREREREAMTMSIYLIPQACPGVLKDWGYSPFLLRNFCSQCHCLLPLGYLAQSQPVLSGSGLTRPDTALVS